MTYRTLHQYDGLVWVRDKTTGLRHRWGADDVHNYPDLEVLKHPVTSPLPALPESTTSSRRKTTSTTASKADEA